MTDQTTRPKHFNRWFPTRPRFQASREYGVLEIKDCLDENGDLIETHPQAWAVETAEHLGTYIERNTQGTGLTIIGVCHDRRPDGGHRPRRPLPRHREHAPAAASPHDSRRGSRDGGRGGRAADRQRPEQGDDSDVHGESPFVNGAHGTRDSVGSWLF